MVMERLMWSVREVGTMGRMLRSSTLFLPLLALIASNAYALADGYF